MEVCAPNLFFGFLLDKVKYSLEAANLAQRNASLGLYDASAGMLLQLLVGCSTLASIEEFLLYSHCSNLISSFLSFLVSVL